MVSQSHYIVLVPSTSSHLVFSILILSIEYSGVQLSAFWRWLAGVEA